MSNYRYGTQSDAYQAENDIVPRNMEKEAKLGLANNPLAEQGSHNDADDLLAAMGYKSELVRSRSTLQVAFMSFVLASVPYGLATTFYYPIVGGGPTNIIWGWVAVSLIILCVAASLGEITSVYPTSGGVYYQTFMIAPPSYRKIASWICGWCFVVGNISITLSVQFATALFFVACVNVYESAPGVGVLEGKPYQVYLIFLGITLICNAVSALGNRYLPLLDTFAIFWTFGGVIAIIVCVLAIAKNGRHSAHYVFTEFDPSNSGWVPGWSFCVGLLHAAYATSSTGMIVSMCEEVRQPATQVPKAMVATVALNTICGLVFMIPLVFILPDQASLAALLSAQPVPTIIKDAVGSSGGAIGLLVPLLVLGLLCGIGCTTAASRATWAFARDGAIPGYKWWRVVNPKLDVPLNAMMLSMVIQLALGLIYFGAAAAFNAFSGVGVICLTLSYAAPILVSVLTGRKHVKGGNFHLGKFGLFCNIVALGWSALATPLFCMPTTRVVTAATTNYASVVLAAVIMVSTIWYFVWGKKNYEGPPTHEDAILEARRASVVTH
ncbi:amino acid transporter [Cucurbitaria berberidis CBS 394.84]|uniref:Amino acid transporter n=1 Tax=Cucurbitaria berberidis CBS 394.84 TaxID=1168544 RepID=A0A9P4GFF7_9PLEO|nr:amino acid transporter [Cucurbitaria berberidis CBS 394.84]KAF1844195.1 amino acid transporter [Cucurbitaria berberidis CBS 394.84]